MRYLIMRLLCIILLIPIVIICVLTDCGYTEQVISITLFGRKP